MSSQTISTRSAQKQVTNLKKVLDLNAKLNSVFSLDRLLTLIMKTAENVMRAQVSSLMLIDESTQELVFRVARGAKGTQLKEKFRVKIGEGIAGWVAQKGKPLIVRNVQKDKRFSSRFDHGTGFTTKSILCVPMRIKKKRIGVLEVINPIGRKYFTDDDLHLLQTFANQAALALENAKLHQAIVQQELHERELLIARQIQQSFLPNLSSVSSMLDIACHNTPARSVSGDFYDVIRVNDSVICVIIGDVAGKGVPASLYMVRVISDFRFFIQQNPNPADILSKLNHHLAPENTLGIFTTLSCLSIDTASKKIHFSSAGHHPILIRQANTGVVTSLECKTGLPLGIDENANYSVQTSECQSGDTLLLYTDGIIEARNRKGEEFSIDRLRDVFKQDYSNADQCMNQVLLMLQNFTQDSEQHDDLTLVSIRIP